MEMGKKFQACKIHASQVNGSRGTEVVSLWRRSTILFLLHV